MEESSTESIVQRICSRVCPLYRSVRLVVVLVALGLGVPSGGAFAQIEECRDGGGADEDVPRVLPLGDSVTEGIGGSDGGGYRTFLWRHVQTDSSLHVNFVGTKESGPETIDRDHEGTGGWLVEDVQNRLNDGLLSACRPDIVLLLIGVNNLGYPPDTDRARRVADEVRGVVERILADSTVSEVIVSSYPLHPNKTQLNGISRINVIAFNDTLKQRVGDLDDAYPDRLSFADMNAADDEEPRFAAKDFTEDGLHPSDSGYERMANVWFTKLDSLLGGAGVPEAEHTALSAFFDATAGSSWTRADNWLSDAPAATWYGVTVEENHVVGLHLAENQLTGELPGVLAGLSHLQRLVLSGNLLQGEIPSDFTMLTSLEEFEFSNTNLCEPTDSSFQDWITGISIVQSTGDTCGIDETPPVCGPMTVETTDSTGYDSIHTFARDEESGISRIEIVDLANLQGYVNDMGPFVENDVKNFDTTRTRVDIRGERVRFDEGVSLTVRIWNGSGKHSDCDSTLAATASDAEEKAGLPKTFRLEQNYPNPFNPTTKIGFHVAEWSHVTLRIYNTAGRMLSSLVNERMAPGSYEVTWNAENHSSGVYLYRIVAGSFHEARPMVLVK